MISKKGIKLHFAISMLVILTVSCTVLISGYSAIQILKSSLTSNYLESNFNYAKKLATSTSELLVSMQQNLNALGIISGNNPISQDELDLWISLNNNQFNSLFITDQDGVIKNISPTNIQFNHGTKVEAGTKIESEAIKKALSIKQAFISEPYRALSGQLILLITSPIYDNTGQYQGLVGGTIYLESDNAIKRLLNDHQYENGSYVYVVDQFGQILFHPKPSRINDLVTNNEAVHQLMQGKTGFAQIINTQEDEFFAGYAYEENSRWGIVSQTPTSIIKEPLKNLLKEMFFQVLPLLMVILIIAWYLAKSLSKPLNKLAKFSEDALNKTIPALTRLNTKSNIYEIHQLYFHINNHFNLLNNQVQLDGLTGLANRRTFDSYISNWVDSKEMFSIILLDIDHFKVVNDQYGHLIGDEVLKYLARMISSVACENDLCFRYGGEEFGILIKNGNENVACDIAEQLRIRVAKTICPTGNTITISTGITSYYDRDHHPNTIIERADSALYHSKANGRNRTTVFTENSSKLKAN